MNKLHELNKIELPPSYGNVFIEQATNDYSVNVLNIGKLLVPTLTFYAKEEKLKHFSYLEHFHKVSVKELCKFETTPNPKILINPNFLMLILKDYSKSLYEYLQNKIFYDVCFIHTPYVDNEQNIYLPLDFYKEFLKENISFLDKSQAIKKCVENNEYYNVNDILEYLFFLYRKNNNDLTVCEVLYKFLYFVKTQQSTNKNKSSQIYNLRYNPEDHYQKSSLNVFVKTHGNLFMEGVYTTHKPKETKKKKKQRAFCNEKHYQNKLKSKIGGTMEVKTPVGYIDLLTETQLIEIKFPHGWKSGIGQILAYSEYYPKHEKVLAIIGKETSISEETYTLCEKHNIVLMFLS